jgi:solute carrier family 35 protein F1/2
MFLIYTNASLFLQDLDSTLFNLSLLTSDVYAVLFAFFVYHTIVHWLYFIAFPLVVLGLIIYHAEASPQQIKNDDDNNQNKENVYNPLSDNE